MAVIAKKLLTYSDYAKIPAAGNRHEIIEGEWIMTPAPLPEHQEVVLAIARLLADCIDSKKLGKVFVAPVDVVLSRHDILEPDVVFVSRRRRSIIKKKNIQGAPDLVVEVSSPSTAAEDRGRKHRTYERRGVREYWIVDLFSRTIVVHEFGRRRRTRILQEGQTFESALLPGLTIAVDKVFSPLE